MDLIVPPESLELFQKQVLGLEIKTRVLLEDLQEYCFSSFYVSVIRIFKLLNEYNLKRINLCFNSKLINIFLQIN